MQRIGTAGTIMLQYYNEIFGDNMVRDDYNEVFGEKMVGHASNEIIRDIVLNEK